ncbi:IclR family transcriptional regulator [Primorskyibacter sedentarius]|uniref:IclR family transcriptional regulator n=1 Tax=Primorskyibacter sedentarius TaxID=745311 RepID=A0A4R3JF61_9RHOB|nr:IclR family transcriptional regulator [Primorskyibacter sedentarius]
MAKQTQVTQRELDGPGTVGRALGILDIVADIGRPARASEIQAASSLPKGTVYRFLQTLTDHGMLSHDPHRRVYFIGARLVRLAHVAWKQSSLAPVAKTHLDALASQVRQTIHLAQLDGGHVLYVDKLFPSRPVEMFSSAGKVGPAYCTGVGKAMMAFLGEDGLASVMAQQSFYRFTDNTLTSPEALLADLALIRKRGFAIDNEEHERGIICVAVPILSRNRILLGGLSITALQGRQDFDDLYKLVPIMQETATRIAADAADWRYPEIDIETKELGT